MRPVELLVFYGGRIHRLNLGQICLKAHTAHLRAWIQARSEVAQLRYVNGTRASAPGISAGRSGLSSPTQEPAQKPHFHPQHPAGVMHKGPISYQSLQLPQAPWHVRCSPFRNRNNGPNSQCQRKDVTSRGQLQVHAHRGLGPGFRLLLFVIFEYFFGFRLDPHGNLQESQGWRELRL